MCSRHCHANEVFTSFSFVKITDVVSELSSGMFMGTVDLKSAYRSVLIPLVKDLILDYNGQLWVVGVIWWIIAFVLGPEWPRVVLID